jgi:hypothetical protein
MSTPGVSADEHEQNKQRKEQKAAIQREVNDLVETLSTPHGRRLAWRIIAESGVFHPSAGFDGEGRVDQGATLLNEGRRNLGLWLIAEIRDASPRIWLTMQQEDKPDEQ